MNAHERNRFGAAVFLDDLVRDTHERATQVVAIEDYLFPTRPFLASLDLVKGTDAASVPAVCDESSFSRRPVSRGRRYCC